MPDTIKERLYGRKSAVVASLVDNTQPDEYISLSLNPDASERGIYSVVAKKKGRSETFRMRYESSMTVKKAMTEFEVYLNTDNPGQFKVIALEPTLPPPPRTIKPQTQVDIWKAQIRQYQKQRYKTTPIENEIEHLKKLINADVSKFRIGDGVGWRATRDQINRGYRIVDMDTVNKMAEIASVADTGLTITGGKSKLPNQAVPIGDLIRDKKYDSKPAFVVADLPSSTRQVEELLPPTRGKKARKRKRKPLPPDAISPQTLPFNSKAATCYGKRTKRGSFRVYCRIKKG